MAVIPILLYHSVQQDPPAWIAPYTVTPDAFAEHIELIVDSGRTPMTVSALAAALRGEAAMPERPVAITFDDGFADFADAAAVLAEHGLPATLYVTTGALSGRGPRPEDMAIPPADMLDWSQLPELIEQGIEIGAHTHTHPQLDILRADAVTAELERSKQLLEDTLGADVPSFAYPHGFQSARTRRLVESAGYSSACAVMNALSSDTDNAYALARLTMFHDTAPFQVCTWLSGLGARVAPYRQRWQTVAWRCYRRAVAPGSDREVINNLQPQQNGER